MTDSVNTRELILGILMEVTKEGSYSHLVIRSVLDKYQYLEKKERAFITRVSEGTIQYMIELDYIINQFSKVKVNKMKPVIRNILRMSVYQLKYMDSVPDSAVCNEAVKLAKRKGFGSLSGFVNGVLRNISRNLSSITYPDGQKDQIQYLSVHYSMPEWIVKQWINDYGMERTVAGIFAGGTGYDPYQSFENHAGSVGNAVERGRRYHRENCLCRYAGIKLCIYDLRF